MNSIKKALTKSSTQATRIIDDYFFRALARINKKIIIFSKEEKSSWDGGGKPLKASYEPQFGQLF